MPEPAPAVAQTEEQRAPLRPTPATPPPGSVPGPVAALIKSPGAGEPLPTQVAERVARSIGVDVGAVRVHTDERSRAATALLNARAFAWGTHVFLGPRERPTDLPLLAHEIVHVVQQQGPGGPAVRLFSTTGPDPYEREAHSVSAAVVGGRRATVAGRTGAPRVQGLWDWAKRGISAIGRGISAAASAIAELGAAALNAALTFIKDHARAIPGYDVLAFVIGKDPITQETVDRNAVNLLKAVAGLIPGGAQLFENIQKAGVIQRAYEWFSTEVAKLGLTWAMIRGLFQQAWDALSVSDLISPSSAWEKIKRIFGPPVGKIVDFAIAAGGKILELIFEGALALGGSAGQYVLSLFRRAQSVFKLIVSDPVKFVGNLVAAVKGGFQKFGSRILEHLKTAIFDWLFGALKGALTLPAKFDLMGIIDIVLQVLGLTYDRFREKLVKLIGEPAVAFVEKAFEFLKILVTQGLKAAWEKLLEFASGLVDTVIGAIRDWVAKSVVVAAITKLVTMFNPLGAIIQAIIGIYNTVMFFIEKAKEIAALVDAIITSVENIAKGNLGQAIDYVEKTLARLLSVLLGFLARFVGLGKVADYVKDVIKKIQDTVDKAVDKAIAWVVDKVKGLIGKDKDKPAVTPAVAAIPEAPFEGHKLWFKQVGDSEVPMVQSEPKPLSEFLDELAKLKLDEDKQAALKAARALVPQMEPIAKRLLKAKPDDQTLDADRKQLQGLELQLVPHLKKLLSGVDLTKFNEIYSLEGVTGVYSQMPTQKGDLLTPDHQPQAAVIKFAADEVFETAAGAGSKTPLFKGLTLVKAAAGHATGAMTINLHDLRHKAGRTWGSKSKTTLGRPKGKLDAISAGPLAPDARRTAVIAVLKEELVDDVDAIQTVAKTNDDDASVWLDIHKLGLGAGQKAFIAKVRAQIISGAARMKTQDLGRYKS